MNASMVYLFSILFLLEICLATRTFIYKKLLTKNTTLRSLKIKKLQYWEIITLETSCFDKGNPRHISILFYLYLVPHYSESEGSGRSLNMGKA